MADAPGAEQQQPTPVPPVGLQGIQGVQGAQGPQGAQGVQGIQGIQGVQGAQGLPGQKGDRGGRGWSGRGRRGRRGQKGAEGQKGMEGERGRRGRRGRKGEKGNTGDAAPPPTTDHRLAILGLWLALIAAQASGLQPLEHPGGPQVAGRYLLQVALILSVVACFDMLVSLSTPASESGSGGRWAPR